MALTAAQVKGRIKNIAAKNNADPRMLMRIYMMDRFLERLTKSEYKNNFIIKGGILVTSMLGVSLRGTMDIDASIKNITLSPDDAQKAVTEIMSVELDDGVSFELKKVDTIMDEMEYPGVRIELDAIMENMITPVKIDISTGDIITPSAIEYSYGLLVEDRSIQILAYNLETILAEKLQTVLNRGIFNTRMRDFYDIHALLNAYGNKIDTATFAKAFNATCKKRNTEGLINQIKQACEEISASSAVQHLWEDYRKKYIYASDISYENAIESVKRLAEFLK